MGRSRGYRRRGGKSFVTDSKITRRARTRPQRPERGGKVRRGYRGRGR